MILREGGRRGVKFSKTADHEVTEIVLRQESAPGSRIAVRDALGEEGHWTVIDCRPDPHGWKVTAVRCLPACREHPEGGVVL
jgi:hypothetical protein